MVWGGGEEEEVHHIFFYSFLISTICNIYGNVHCSSYKNQHFDSMIQTHIIFPNTKIKLKYQEKKTGSGIPKVIIP